LAWKINFKPKAERELASLDKQAQKRIVHYIEHKIAPLPNPRQLGVPLRNKLKGLWKYRIGDYRLICEINDSTVTVLVVSVGHRKEVYREI
jgi:mRNA interferase RelE/StbE